MNPEQAIEHIKANFQQSDSVLAVATGYSRANVYRMRVKVRDEVERKRLAPLHRLAIGLQA
jgi:hypothetical protein